MKLRTRAGAVNIMIGHDWSGRTGGARIAREMYDDSS
jgi:hypothetical protein